MHPGVTLVNGQPDPHPSPRSSLRDLASRNDCSSVGLIVGSKVSGRSTVSTRARIDRDRLSITVAICVSVALTRRT